MQARMALVAYDYSDSSDLEDNEEGKATKILTSNNSAGQFTEGAEVKQDNNTEDETFKLDPSIAGESLFNLLPQPAKRKSAVVEEDDEFLHKKENQNSIFKPKAKITVPSLSDFKDVEGTVPHAKPRATTEKKSGLLSILPQPRNSVSKSTTTKSFVPHILTKKPETTLKKQNPLPSSAKQLRSEVKLLAKDSDESDNEEVQNDFFSIYKTDDLLVEDIPLDMDKPKAVSANVATSSKKPIPNIQSYFKQDILTEHSELHPNSSDNTEESHRPYAATEGYETSNAQASNTNETVLDEKAIMKLCGTRGKRKREEIQIVDVNQKEVLADAREWLLKGLMDDTTKRVSASKRRGDEPTSQQRRKHQITYLAHQAKANESELQNQWANNRVSKRQTQSKYGF